MNKPLKVGTRIRAMIVTGDRVEGKVVKVGKRSVLVRFPKDKIFGDAWETNLPAKMSEFGIVRGMTQYNFA